MMQYYTLINQTFNFISRSKTKYKEITRVNKNERSYNFGIN